LKVIIHPSSLTGDIQVPASKSSMQRACAAALLHVGETILKNPGHSNDDKAALSIIQNLGAKVEWKGDAVHIQSNGVNPVSNELNCGESGLSIRMFTPIASISKKEISIIGSGSLLTRPMNFFDEVLPLLSIDTNTNAGKLPLIVKGPLKPATISIDGSLSSQFLTGLLMAYSALTPKGVSIEVIDLASKPYIDLTLSVMRDFGMKMPVNHDYKRFEFAQDDFVADDKNVEYTVEADWSSASFLLVAGAIAGPIHLKGLDLLSTQADKAIMDALMSAGAGVAIDAKGITVHPTTMNGFEFNAFDCPDLFPPLVALASFCNGRSTISGVSRLKHKESDRATALIEEFTKLGVEIYLDGDSLVVVGGEKLIGATVHSHHDHRIAMATAVAALRADGDTIIEEAFAVSKSYPNFYSDLQLLGASLTLPQKNFTL
jgi:3-phosphoshikimate 1-carboxyvinyltransferase